MGWLKCVGYGIVTLVSLGGIGFLVGLVFRSPMRVDDECEPTDHGRKETKARQRFSRRKAGTE